MLCTLVAVFTLDRWGRRFTLFYGAVAQGISLILVAVLTKPDIMAKDHLVSLLLFPLRQREIADRLSRIGIWYWRHHLHFQLYWILWYDMVNCSMVISGEFFF